MSDTGPERDEAAALIAQHPAASRPAAPRWTSEEDAKLLQIYHDVSAILSASSLVLRC